MSKLYYNIPTLNSFADVERRYENTAPLGGHSPLSGMNIRPLSLRRAPWLRIHKVSRSCYAILSGADGLPSSWEHIYNYPDVARVSPAEYKKVAAVVWWKTKDGYEHIKIRNAPWRNSNVHYALLNNVLPRDLLFRNSNGTKWIDCGGECWPLPHSKTVCKWYIEKRNSNSPKRNKFIQPHEDGNYVHLRRPIGTSGWNEWERVHAPSSQPPTEKLVVDKQDKAKLVKPLREYKEWVRIMMPLMMPNYDPNKANPYGRNVPDIALSHNAVGKFIAGYMHETETYFEGTGYMGREHLATVKSRWWEDITYHNIIGSQFNPFPYWNMRRDDFKSMQAGRKITNALRRAVLIDCDDELRLAILNGLVYMELSAQYTANQRHYWHMKQGELDLKTTLQERINRRINKNLNKLFRFYMTE